MGLCEHPITSNIPIWSDLRTLHVRASLSLCLPKKGNPSHLVWIVLRRVVRQSRRDEEDD